MLGSMMGGGQPMHSQGAGGFGAGGARKPRRQHMWNSPEDQGFGDFQMGPDGQAFLGQHGCYKDVHVGSLSACGSGCGCGGIDAGYPGGRHHGGGSGGFDGADRISGCGVGGGVFALGGVGESRGGGRGELRQRGRGGGGRGGEGKGRGRGAPGAKDRQVGGGSIVHHHPPKEALMAAGQPSFAGNQTLLIAYFPWEATEGDIEREFSRFCRVKRVRLVVEKSSHAPRCFGFVKFDSKFDAENALVATQQGLVQLKDSRGHIWHLKAEWTKSGDMVVDSGGIEAQVASRRAARVTRRGDQRGDSEDSFCVGPCSGTGGGGSGRGLDIQQAQHLAQQPQQQLQQPKLMGHNYEQAPYGSAGSSQHTGLPMQYGNHHGPSQQQMQRFGANDFSGLDLLPSQPKPQQWQGFAGQPFFAQSQEAFARDLPQPAQQPHQNFVAPAYHDEASARHLSQPAPQPHHNVFSHDEVFARFPHEDPFARQHQIFAASAPAVPGYGAVQQPQPPPQPQSAFQLGGHGFLAPTPQQRGPSFGQQPFTQFSGQEQQQAYNQPLQRQQQPQPAQPQFQQQVRRQGPSQPQQFQHLQPELEPQPRREPSPDLSALPRPLPSWRLASTVPPQQQPQQPREEPPQQPQPAAHFAGPGGCCGSRAPQPSASETSPPFHQELEHKPEVPKGAARQSEEDTFGPLAGVLNAVAGRHEHSVFGADGDDSQEEEDFSYMAAGRALPPLSAPGACGGGYSGVRYADGSRGMLPSIGTDISASSSEAQSAPTTGTWPSFEPPLSNDRKAGRTFAASKRPMSQSRTQAATSTPAETWGSEHQFHSTAHITSVTRGVSATVWSCEGVEKEEEEEEHEK